MLERYHEEVQRKKFAYRIFWFVVLAFATLLYMFFQGYYFSMQVGFERLMHVGKENSYSTGSNDSMVKPFGIINIKVDPSPNLLTINDQKYQNGDKSIFDYGNYTIEIAEDGFLPIQIKTILDRQVPFYINSIRLIRTPVSREIPLSREANSIGTDILLKNASGSYTLSSTSFSGMTTVGTGGITYRDE